MSIPVDKVLHLPASKSLLANLQGESVPVWKYFLMCLETPRPSGKLDSMRKKILDKGEKLGLYTRVDEAGNVLIRKPASSGSSADPSLWVCIQSHMDMVTSKNDNVAHNFDTDPIQAYVDGEWLKARSTTLGADDGIGVAASLALLENDTFVFSEEGGERKQLEHPNLELLFTADEETTMSGAEFIAKDLLKSSVLLNVDHEEENSICIGCAGGFEKTGVLAVDWTTVPDSHKCLVSVSLAGLLGGHSGVQIHEPLGNGIQLLGEILLEGFLDSRLCQETFYLSAYNGGTAVNAIPREAVSLICIRPEVYELVHAVLKEMFEKIVRSRFDINQEPHALLSMTKLNETEYYQSLPRGEDGKPVDAALHAGNRELKGISPQCTLEALHLIVSLPHGVLERHSEMNSIIEVSNAFTITRLNEQGLFIHMFARFNNDEKGKLLAVKFDRDFAPESWNPKVSSYFQSCKSSCLDSAFQPHSFKLSSNFNIFPGWTPNPSSPALALVIKAFSESRNGQQPHVFACHAGLECGLIQNAYKHMDCVSIGPEVKNAHSPDEKLYIPSVHRFMRVLVRSLHKLATETF